MERRASRPVIEGHRRGRFLAERLGVALRDERTAAALSQAELAGRCLLSQSRVSQLERGDSRATLDTWSVVAAVLGRQLAAFVERSSGANMPRDVQHLRGQDLLIREAAAGGWRALPEERVEIETGGHRFVDVVLVRATTGEASVHEIWDLLVDVGEAMRGFDVKVEAVRNRLAASETRAAWRTSGLWLVRATQRNRALVRQFSALFAAKFPGSGDAWMLALHDGTHRMPDEPGLVWLDVAPTRLIASRPHTGQATNRARQ